MRLIFVPTIQSTGTWFTLKFLEEHSQVKYASPWATLDHEMLGWVEGAAAVQVHFGEGKRNEAELKAFTNYAEVEAWMDRADAVVSPVRDPLRSMLTAKSRDFDNCLEYIVNGFCKLAEWHGQRRVFLLPVDLLAAQPWQDRHRELRRLLVHVGLPYEGWVLWWATDWPVHNSVNKRRFERARKAQEDYESRDTAAMAAFLGDDYGYLAAREAILRPFLEGLGYRGLAWWS